MTAFPAGWRQATKEFLAVGMLLFLIAWIIGLALAAGELTSGTRSASQWIRDFGGYGFAICTIAEVLFYLAELGVKLLRSNSGTGQNSS